MKLRKAVGISEFLRKKFEFLDIPDEWRVHLGELPQRFTISVYGGTANGKTDYCIKMAKMLSAFGNVLYDSFEQGISAGLQKAIARNDMQEVNGKVTFVRDNFDELIERLSKRKSAKFIFIDSRDQMKLSYDQFVELETRFPKKSFIVIMYEKGAKPKGEHGISIEYKCEIKVRVRLFVAMIVGSRADGSADFVISETKAREAREKIKMLKQLTNEKS